VRVRVKGSGRVVVVRKEFRLGTLKGGSREDGESQASSLGGGWWFGSEERRVKEFCEGGGDKRK